MGKDLNGKELGSHFSQRKNGTYSARYFDRFGQKHDLYSKSLTELRRKYKEAVHQDAVCKNVKTDYTLDEWFQKWLSIYKIGIRANTKRHYNHVFEKQISPFLGSKLLKKITTLDVTLLINDLQAQGYRYETLNKVRIILLDMFNRAVIDEFALKNPVKGIKITRDEKADPRVLTVSEQQAFFQACSGDFYEDAFIVQVSTGLRPGELFALDAWKDIDFTRREITVDKTLLYQKLSGDTRKTFHIDPPKTASSRRKVKFDERCAVALRNQIRRKQEVTSSPGAKPIPGLENLLFVTKFNTPICPQIYNDAIRRIVDKINVDRDEAEQFEVFSGHCFRHTYATRCFEAGIPPKTVQQQLGHASLKMTMDLYTHVLSDQRELDLQKYSAYADKIFSTI